MKLNLINSLLIAVIFILIPKDLLSQNPFSFQKESYQKYDKRFILPEIKRISLFSLAGVFSIDDEPLFREMSDGNIDTGLNFGLGIHYSMSFINNNYLSVFCGAGYEFFPEKYQKIKVFVEYKSPLIFGIIDFFPKYEYIVGWDIKTGQIEFQDRIFFVNIHYKRYNLYWGIQNWDERFDDGFYIFEFTYNYFPKKW